MKEYIFLNTQSSESRKVINLPVASFIPKFLEKDLSLIFNVFDVDNIFIISSIIFSVSSSELLSITNYF